MKESLRWFGPADVVRIGEVQQTGVKAVVSALHHIAPGAVWTPQEIAKRQAEISVSADGRATGLEWNVVESLPVSEDIKRQSGNWKAHIETYRESMQNLADAGLSTICYNFMPVLDWTRTNLAWPMANGTTCMRFDWVDFTVFDIYLLQRPDENYSADIREAAAQRYASMSESDLSVLTKSVNYGLPGEGAAPSLDVLRRHLSEYQKIDAQRLRVNQYDFLEQVCPLAEKLGLRLCCHPDDPPFELMGLPRIMSTEADYQALIDAVDTPANGITLCSGSLGARSDNDLPGMMQRLGHRVHFLHLRNTRREGTELHGSFHESGHIEGDTDMVQLVAAVLDEEAKRKATGRADWTITFRPDHGLDMLNDIERGGQPGYPLIGRLAGLSELRGIIAAQSTLAQRQGPQ
ncbi:MAG: mannonate dehydratase [Rhodobacteraceae bacterium]|nr:MAG: mannonate dehydratase [Paracoccaceae bacterium]